MKRIITLVSLVLSTFPSLSQTSTKTQSDSIGGVTKEQLKKDSLVAIPKTLAIWMAQDVARARSYSEEIVLLNGSVALKQSIIGKQDTIISSYKGKLSAYVSLYNSCNESNQIYEAQIAYLKKDLRIKTAQKKFWRVTAFIMPMVVGGFVHYHWKYLHW